MMTTGYLLGVLALAAGATWFTRALPFMLFGGKKGIPPLIGYLGKILPTAMMAVLVIYCLKGLPAGTGSDAIFQLSSLLLVALLHFWKHNTVLSIFGGTALYMLLIRLPF